MNLRDQKGINLITLSIAIIILIIITSVLVYNSKDGTKIKTLSNLYNDIESLDKKVSSYYVEHGDLPKLGEYTNTTFISGLDAKQNNPNNAGKYYVIDLKALEGVSLNYGRDFSSVSPTDDRIVALDDIYIINEVSHTIYYPKGIDVQNVTYHTKPENWTDISLSIIPIYTAEQLSWVGDGQTHAVNGLNYTFSLDGTYMLKNDIDLSSVCSEASGRNWIQIGSRENPFTGNLYGNGHEIQNIYINNTTNNDVVGLFRTTGGNSRIQDLGVTGKITSEVAVDAGGIAGTVYSNNRCTFINCYSNVNITSQSNQYCLGGILSASDGNANFINCYNIGSISGSSQAGGIIGYDNGNVTINNCYNTGKISNSVGNYCGGLVGVNLKTLEVINSYNKGEVTNTKAESRGTGGILGEQHNDTGTTTITNCQNHNKVKADVYVGGIAGLIRKGTVENCENTGAIEGTAVNSSHGCVGGINGYTGGAVTTSKCKNTGEIYAKANCIGGICGSNNYIVRECFNNGTLLTEGNSGVRWSNWVSK